MRTEERRVRMMICVAGLAMLVLAASTSAADLPEKFDPARDAARDVATAVSLARAEGKRVIVDVGGEWCPWCHTLDRFVATHAAVGTRARAHYVWVKVNVSKANRNDSLLARWPRIAGYPHLFVLDASGRLLHSQDTGLLEAGDSYDEARMVDFLDRWSHD